MSRALALRLPVLADGHLTGHVEISRTTRITHLPAQLRVLGFRLTTTCRGRLAVERLH
jgi:hypothetical protein